MSPLPDAHRWRSFFLADKSAKQLTGFPIPDLGGEFGRLNRDTGRRELLLVIRTDCLRNIQGRLYASERLKVKGVDVAADLNCFYRRQLA